MIIIEQVDNKQIHLFTRKIFQIVSANTNTSLICKSKALTPAKYQKHPESKFNIKLLNENSPRNLIKCSHQRNNADISLVNSSERKDNTKSRKLINLK